MRLPTPSLLLAAALLLPGGAGPLRAEMTDAERGEFRDEVRAYLLENPELLNEMVALLEARERDATATADRERIARHSEALFTDGFSFVGGNPAGSVTVVEFLDYQCGYCRRAHPDVTELIASDGDIRLIVKEMPILGPGSEIAARAAVATLIAEGPEAYAALNDRLMRMEGPVTQASVEAAVTAAGLDPARVRAGMEDPEVTRRLDATRKLALDLDISGTPTFVFADQMLRGVAPIAAMRELVATIRAAD